MNEGASGPGVRVTRLVLLAAAGLCLLLGAVPARASVSAGSNYRLGSDLTPGRGKDAIGLAVDPRNARHIAEINADWLTAQCEHHVSFDGGRTWRGGTFRVPAPYSLFPCSVGHHLAAAIQGGIVYGSAGNVYATFVSAVPLPGGQEGGKSLFVAISRNGGRTFGTAKLLAQAGATVDQSPDYTLPTIGVDPARHGGPRRDRVYVAADTTNVPHGSTTSVENIVMARSANAGRTWTRVANVNPSPEMATEQSQPVVGHDGAVYITWREQIPLAAGSTSTNGYIVVSKSRNHGRTWASKRIALVHGYNYVGPPVPPFTGGGSFQCCNFPRIAIDPRRNDVYVVFGEGQVNGLAHVADHFINPASAVWFMRSTNGGGRWSSPVRINHPAPLTFQVDQTRHPSVSVAGNGRVDIVWQDRRNWYHACVHTHVACQEARLGDTYYAYSTNRGRSFSANYRISDRSTNNDVGYDYRFGTYWAYGPTSVPLAGNHLLIGWMDSRAGNLQNDSQDIYLSQVTVGAAGPVPVGHLSLRRNPIAMSVALSRLAYPAGPEAVLGGTFSTRPWTRVVIVNQKDVSGALAAGVLARANLGTVLLSSASGLSPAVRAEVRRLQPIGAYVVGSQTALSAKIVSDLAAAGVPASQIVRLAGANSADTAGLIAAAADRRTAANAGSPAFDAAIIANPGRRDAVDAAVLAADRRLPVLYVNRNTVPAQTTAALKALGITKTLVLGGARSVSSTVMRALPSAQRIGGADAYSTSRKLLGASIKRGVPSNQVFLTDGKNPMLTALLGAPIARIGGLQLVARGGPTGALKIAGASVGGSVTRLIMVK